MGIEKPKGKKEVSDVRDETKQELGELSQTLKFEHKFPVGKGDLPAKKQKEADALDFEKDKSYHFDGIVDQLPFQANLKPASFYRKKAEYARQILEDFDSVKISFSTFKGLDGKARAKEMLQYLVDTVPANSKTPFDTVKWKKNTELRYSSDQIYGAEGIFNLTLAYKRAVDKMRARVKKSGAHATFELKLSPKGMPERALRVYEVNKLAEKVLKDSVKEGVSESKIFNKYMTEYADLRSQLVSKVVSHKLDGELFSAQADEFFKRLDALNCRDASTPSYEDYIRMDSIDRALDSVGLDLKKMLEQNKVGGKKAEGNAVAAESRESVASREHARRVESILNRGDLKDRYVIAENPETTVALIVNDVIKVCNLPIQFNLKTLQDLKTKLTGVARARVNSAIAGGAKEIVFDQKDKTTFVEMVLQVVDFEKGLQGSAKAELLRDQMAH